MLSVDGERLNLLTANSPVAMPSLSLHVLVLFASAGAGMVVDWEQETGLLMTSGDVRVVRIWDTDREMKVQVLITMSTPNLTHPLILLLACFPVCLIPLPLMQRPEVFRCTD